MPGEIETITHIKIGENEHPIDAVTVNGQTPPDESSYLAHNQDNTCNNTTFVYPLLLYDFVSIGASFSISVVK